MGQMLKVWHEGDEDKPVSTVSTLADLEPYRMALKHGWNITPEMRQTMISELNKMISDPGVDDRSKTKAMALLAQCNKQNIDLDVSQQDTNQQPIIHITMKPGDVIQALPEKDKDARPS